MSTFLKEHVAREFALQRMSQESVNVIDVIKSFYLLRDCNIYEGKVSTCISGGPLVAQDGTPLRIMIRTPRISTHDVKRGEIPFKDQVLAINHNFMRKLVERVMPHTQLGYPGVKNSSIVTVAADLKSIKVEFVMRAYNAVTTTSTSLYQHYTNGVRTFCGHKLSDNLEPNAELPFIMDTPSTKEGHDRSVSPETLYAENLCTPEQYRLMKTMGLAAFKRVASYLISPSRWIILADTKIEFGIDERSAEIVAMDELFTMDSSRFWATPNWINSVGKHEQVVSWSKEFARGLAKGDEPYTQEQQVEIAVRYMLGIQELTEQPFIPDMTPIEEQITTSIKSIFELYSIK